MSSQKYKLKQRDDTTNLSEWPKYGTLITPNADKDTEQLELSATAAGDASQHTAHSLGKRVRKVFIQN